MNTSLESPQTQSRSTSSTPPDELLLASILRQADAQFGRQEWLAARVSLELAASVAPENTDILNALGSLQYQLKEYPAACATFTAAIARAPGNADLPVQLAMVHLQLGQATEAKAAIQASLRLRAANPHAHHMLGDLEFAARSWAAAAEQYCAALEGNPGSVASLLQLGRCQMELGDAASARWCLEQALALEPQNAEVAALLRTITGDDVRPAVVEKKELPAAPATPETGCGCGKTAGSCGSAADSATTKEKAAKPLTVLNRAPAAEAPAEPAGPVTLQVDPQYREEHEELLARAYAEARRPYLETVSPIPAHAFELPSWRYFVEINSGCNLRCTMCIRGDSRGYGHKNGFMDQDLFEKILDKIKVENSKADICLYGNSEPFLHPRLADCVAAVKRRGLTCLVSTNLNIVKNLKEVLQAKPDAFIISVSGFTQEVYGRAHVGGDIELVKANMKLVAQTRAETGSAVPVLVHYHLYQDNWGEEYDRMKAFATELGFTITVSWARSISMEKTIQYLRHHEKKTKGAVPPLRVSPAGYGAKEALISLFPEVTETFLQDIDRLGIKPDEATEIYKKYPEPAVCPVGDMFTYIRYDGSVSLCSCVSDTRLTVAADFLTVTQEQLHRRRRFNPLCRECLRYKMHMYYHIVDIPMWDKTMAQKFPAIPVDRRKF